MEDKVPPALTKRQESLRDAFASRVSRLSTFAVSVLVLLLLLLLVVEQQIREYDQEIHEAAHLRTRAGTRLAASLQTLKSLRISFFNLVPRPEKLSPRSTRQNLAKQLTAYVRERAAEPPSGPEGAMIVSAPQDEKVPALASGPLMGAEIVAMAPVPQEQAFTAPSVEPESDEYVPAPAPQSNEKVLDRDEHLYERVLSARFLGDGTWEQKPPEFTKAEEQLRSEAKEERRRSEGEEEPLSSEGEEHRQREAELAQALMIIEEYSDKAHTMMQQRANVVAAAERIRKVHATKESLPTPFGSFQIDPRLALLAMAFAGLFAYIFFNVSARYARTLARELADSLEPQQRRIYAVPTPSWFFTDSVAAAEVLILPSRTWMAAAPLHFGWLLLAVVLCCEAWRWSAAHALLIGRWDVTYVLLAGTAALAVALAVDFIHPRIELRSQMLRGLQPILAVRLNRRQAIYGSAIAVAAIGGGMALRKWLRKGKRLPVAALAQEVSVPIYSLAEREKWSPNLTAHKSSGVVHHLDACAHHLPKKKNRKPVPAGGIVHRGWEPAILYEASKQIDTLNTLTFGRFRDRMFEKEIESLEERIDREYRKNADPTKVEADLRAAVTELWKQLPDRFSKSREADINRRRTGHMIHMLLRAIELQPWSYHLHHRLIRIYGRLHRYHDIARLIERSRKLAAEALAESPRAKKILKAKAEFDSWPAKIERRKARAREKEEEKKKEERENRENERQERMERMAFPAPPGSSPREPGREGA